ncbi:nitrophenyl compound nitroreductase subunit ArsF family protein [Parabacteroides sp. OttesenSCG-928-N08]|nr:nitrophenyl compound nitroreductase subunit ArsF family protein [Parabacteroides sp. OttesenSCG-928-N08]
MKKSILIGLMAVTLFTACGQANSKKEGKETSSTETTVQSAEASVVNVYYFHGKQRCKTCIAVGNVTEETIKELYADNSSVKFIEVDTSDKKNEALVEKYEVSWNALIIAKGNNSIDITERAFASALNNPEALTNLIKEEVNNRLK